MLTKIRARAGWLRGAALERLVTVTTDRRVLALTPLEKYEVLSFQLPRERHNARFLVGAASRSPFFQTAEGKKVLFSLVERV